MSEQTEIDALRILVKKQADQIESLKAKLRMTDYEPPRICVPPAPIIRRPGDWSWL